MKAEEKKIIDAFIGKTLNLSAEESASLFKKNGDDEELQPEALKTLLESHAKGVKAAKEKEKELFDNGYKKASADLLGKRDKALKEKYGLVDSEKEGDELLDEIISIKTKADTLDEEKVKVHPLYLKMEKEKNKEIEKARKEGEEKLNAREQEIASEKMFSEILSFTDTELAALKPILPADPAKAKNQKGLLVSDLKGFKYEKIGDDYFMIKPDGKRLEDDHGKPVTLKNFVKETSSKYWDFENGESKSGSGGSNDDEARAAAAGAAAGKTKWTKAIPKNDAEFSKTFATLKTPEERIAFTEAYESSQKSS